MSDLAAEIAAHRPCPSPPEQWMCYEHLRGKEHCAECGDPWPCLVARLATKLDTARVWSARWKTAAKLHWSNNSDKLLDEWLEMCAERDTLRQAARAFVSHHDAGQAPNQPRTLADEDVWHAEWDRRLASLRALVPAEGTGDGGVRK